MASSSSKLFHVLVVGGIALGAGACSSDGMPGSDSGTTGDSAGGGSDATNDGPPADAGAGGMDTSMPPKDSGCLNKPGDCTHGTCAW